MILITSLGEFAFIFYYHFLFFSYIKKKEKKTVMQDLCCFCVALFLPLLQESIFSGLKILKASSSVGKLTVIKWNT